MAPLRPSRLAARKSLGANLAEFEVDSSPEPAAPPPARAAKSKSKHAGPTLVQHAGDTLAPVGEPLSRRRSHRLSVDPGPLEVEAPAKPQDDQDNNNNNSSLAGAPSPRASARKPSKAKKNTPSKRARPTTSAAAGADLAPVDQDSLIEGDSLATTVIEDSRVVDSSVIEETGRAKRAKPATVPAPVVVGKSRGVAVSWISPLGEDLVSRITHALLAGVFP